MGCLTAWLVTWLFGCLAVSPPGRLAAWLTDWLPICLAECRPSYWLTIWMINWFNYRTDGCWSVGNDELLFSDLTDLVNYFQWSRPHSIQNTIWQLLNCLGIKLYLFMNYFKFKVKTNPFSSTRNTECQKQRQTNKEKTKTKTTKTTSKKKKAELFCAYRKLGSLLDS